MILPRVVILHVVRLFAQARRGDQPKKKRRPVALSCSQLNSSSKSVVVAPNFFV